MAAAAARDALSSVSSAGSNGSGSNGPVSPRAGGPIPVAEAPDHALSPASPRRVNLLPVQSAASPAADGKGATSTSTSTPASPNVAASSAVDSEMKARLIAGGWFLKHGRKGRPHRRWIACSGDLVSVMWSADAKVAAKADASVFSSSITDVVAGRTTDIFKRIKIKPKDEQIKQNLSFSIICRDRV
jgi:hypothetical protein